jgi:hypothetical protein
LNVARSPTLGHHKIIAMGIKLGAQYFYINDAVTPQKSQGIAGESMLHNAFS